MEECVHRTWMPLLPATVNWYFWQINGYSSRMEKVVKSEIVLGLSFSVPDLVFKFQIDD